MTWPWPSSVDRTIPWRARAVDTILCAYGSLPYHPGKWRIANALMPLAAATWRQPRLATVRGVRYELDLQDRVPREILYHGEYEPAEAEFLRRFVHPGDVVIDAGGQIGYHTLLLSRLVGAAGKVYSFEPSPHNFDRLLRNLSLNQVSNVQAERCGLADRSGTAQVIQSRANTGSTHLREAGPADASEPCSPVVALDHYLALQPPRRISFVKIDVEGFELKLLQGAGQLLERCQPAMLLELNPESLARVGHRAEQIVALLADYRYDLYRTVYRGLSWLERLPSGGEYFNIVALPRTGPVTDRLHRRSRPRSDRAAAA